MPNTARVFARLMDWGQPAGSPADGVVIIRVEWSLLDGTRTNGKFKFTTEPLSTRNRLTNDTIDALVVSLNDQFPSANYSDRDILLWGN